MIDLEFLQSLIRALDESGLDSVELERGGTRVRLSKTPPPVVPSAPAAAVPEEVVREAPTQASSEAPPAGEDGEVSPSNLAEIVSPMVGTFYRAPAPDAPPYVEEGDRVSRGETICVIEAMKLMNELEADVSGTIVEVCVDNAEPVEYGQVLFRVEPS
jgi:acetyl-CoA carboxylase biotin carboxyl carrier protein